MAILMLINLKGGVAKTTSAVALAECLASQGHRTLLIDADHQCTAGELLLGEAGQLAAERQRQTLYHLLAAMLRDDFSPQCFPGYVRPRASDIGGGLANLSVLPCSLRMEEFAANYARAKRGYWSNDEFLHSLDLHKRQLRGWLTGAYDFTVIDCPPSLALQVRALLSLADGLVVPCVPDRLSVRGCWHLLRRLRAQGFQAPALGTLWSLYRQQNALHRQFVTQAARGRAPFDQLPEPFRTVIPNAATIPAAAEPGQHPASFRQKYSPPFARLFEELCGEIVQRAEWHQAPQRAVVLANAN